MLAAWLTAVGVGALAAWLNRAGASPSSVTPGHTRETPESTARVHMPGSVPHAKEGRRDIIAPGGSQQRHEYRSSSAARHGALSAEPEISRHRSQHGDDHPRHYRSGHLGYPPLAAGRSGPAALDSDRAR